MIIIFTEKVPKILSLDDEQIQIFSHDCVRFKQYMQSHIFVKTIGNINFFIQIAPWNLGKFIVNRADFGNYFFVDKTLNGLLRANNNINLYAVDKKSGKILGSTMEGKTGKNLSEIGISHERALSDSDGFAIYLRVSTLFSTFGLFWII